MQRGCDHESRILKQSDHILGWNFADITNVPHGLLRHELEYFLGSAGNLSPVKTSGIFTPWSDSICFSALKTVRWFLCGHNCAGNKRNRSGKPYRPRTSRALGAANLSMVTPDGMTSIWSGESSRKWATRSSLM